MMIELSDCDVVFMSFDEPNADDNFEQLQDVLPRVKRVHGVVGFDAAHRQAGETATSRHVITIDADNLVIDPGFMNGSFEVSARDLGSVFSFSARNVLNGLEYGNGGVKIWPRTALLALRSHENAGRTEAAVDFCWTVPYFQVNRVLSEVHMTTTPAQAFRGGFREGVKFNLAGGSLAYQAFPNIPKAEALPKHIGKANYERLRVWCSVGADIENGDWALFGARLGCVMTALDGFDPALVADYAWFQSFWETEIFPTWSDKRTRADRIRTLGTQLNDELELHIADLDADASLFVKSVFRGKRAYGPMEVV